MDTFLIIAIAVVVIFFAFKIFYRSSLYKRYTGTVTGRFLYTEWKGNINGRVVEARWNPVCEYCVDDIAYIVELEIFSPNQKFDIDEVEVRYLPSNPEVCFISGTRGKILSTHKNTV